jgi:Protein of unknown function (DUF1059)
MENPMTISLPCRLCDAVVTGDDEDDLVTRMQAHAAEEHDKHGLSRRHVLRHLHAPEPHRPLT